MYLYFLNLRLWCNFNHIFITMECNYITHLMWFGPGVHVVAQVPVAGPVKNKKSV